MSTSRPGVAVAAAVVLAAALARPALCAGAREPPVGQSGGRPVVVVSILPQAYFVERIAGSRVKTVVLVGPGQSPHAYEPTPAQMADLAAAAVWFTIGVEFEKGLAPKVRSLYPGLPLVDTTAGIRFRKLEEHDHVDGGAEDDHDASGKDTHTWLGRAAAKSMAATISDRLSALDPAGGAAYAAGCEAFLRDIDGVFDSLVTDLARLRGKTAFVYHPAFGYLLDDLGIAQVAVETGGKEPTQKQLAELIGRARKEGARVIFVQAQFPASAAKAVADAIGGAVVAMDPLARDWLDNIGRLGKALRSGL